MGRSLWVLIGGAMVIGVATAPLGLADEAPAQSVGAQSTEVTFDEAAHRKAMEEHKERMSQFQFDAEAHEKAMKEHRERMGEFQFDEAAHRKAVEEYQERMKNVQFDEEAHQKILKERQEREKRMKQFEASQEQRPEVDRRAQPTAAPASKAIPVAAPASAIKLVPGAKVATVKRAKESQPRQSPKQNFTFGN